jgi:amino acid adenylation domain-containing protein
MMNPSMLPAIVPQPRTCRVPLSFAQHALWVADRLQGPATKYNLCAAWRLRGRLDRGALTRALNALVARHEVLRTRFAELDGEPIQVIEPTWRLRIPLQDLSGLADDERQRRAMHALDEEWQRPFDLGTGPLLRMKLLKLHEDEYVLVRTVHHIACDGWSLGIFNRELSELYAAAREGRGSSLPPLDVQYADVALWQQHCLGGEALRDGLEYWKQQLEGIPEHLTLPADQARSHVDRFDGRAFELPLPDHLVPALTRLGRQHRASLYMTTLAAFAALLGRYSGQDDVVIGSPTADRQAVCVEGLIGLFTNELAMRVRVGSRQTFDELLAQVRETAIAAYSHQHVPFELVVQETSATRSRTTTPVFQVGFGLQPAQTVPALVDLSVEPWRRAEHVATKLDIEVQLLVHGDRAQLFWLYNRHLFADWRMERMARHYLQLLSAIAAQPHAALGQLPMLTGEECGELEALHGPVQSVPDATVAALFEAQVSRTPDAIAVTCGDESLTYAALNRQSNRLAAILRAFGVRPDSVVPVCAERSLELVVGMLGVLKAGAAYLGIDPFYPRDRIAFMLDDSHAALVLTDSRAQERVAHANIPLVLLDDYGTEEAAYDTPCENPTAAAGPQNLAYVIYTSGSTGKPKAVAVDHRALCNHMTWLQAQFPLGADDRVLQRTSISFDASVWEFWAPLLTGAQLIMAPPERHADGGSVLRWITAHAITVVQMVPSLLRLFIDADSDGEAVSLRRIFCGGEPLPRELVEHVLTRLPGVELHNLYGPTEATIDASAWTCGAADTSAPPIGRPIANTRAYVLDRASGRVPIGVAGELFIAGAGLARGYLGRPSLTAERFLPDPYGRPGARMYRTGDRARWRQDGVLELIGRGDDQVKIRGFRMELGEIEAALRAVPSVAQAVAVARDDEGGSMSLLGYVVFERGATMDSAALQEHLRRTLPEYMVPSTIVALDALPLMPNGKIDRRSLPAPAKPRSEYRAPRTPVEQTLCAIFAEVLGVARIGIDDDFFALGGHSLSAMRAIMRSRAQLGIELSFRALLERGTVAAIADQFTDAASAKTVGRA